MPAPTPVASYNVNSAASNTTALVTPSFTPATGEIVVLKCVSEDSTKSFATPTATGGGITWTKRIENVVTSNTYNAIWTGTVTAGGSSITISSGALSAAGFHSMVVERYTNAQLAATPATNKSQGSGTGNTPTGTLTTVSDGSIVSSCDGDWNANAPGTPAYRSSGVQDGIHDVSPTSYVAYFWTQPTTTAGAQTYGMTTPAAGQIWTQLAIEIQGVSTVAAAEGPRRTVRPTGRGPYGGRLQFLTRPGDTSFSGAASPITITPPVGTMLWAGVVPAVQAGATIVPPVAAITLAGVAPAVTAGATIAPPVAAITLAGVAPTIQAGVTITPPVGVITWAGVAPAVQAGVTVTPPVATTTWAGVVPAVQAAATITPPKGTTTWAGVAPAIQAGVTIVPPVGTFTWAGVVPSISAGGSASISPPVATITMAGVAPTISAGVTIVPPVAHMTWAGVAPVVTAGVTITTPVGNLTWAGIAPVISSGGTLRDLTLVAIPLAKRWAVTPLPGRWAATEIPERWGTIGLPERWATTPLPERWATTPEER